MKGREAVLPRRLWHKWEWLGPLLQRAPAAGSASGPVCGGGDFFGGGGGSFGGGIGGGGGLGGLGGLGGGSCGGGDAVAGAKAMGAAVAAHVRTAIESGRVRIPDFQARPAVTDIQPSLI